MNFSGIFTWNRLPGAIIACVFAMGSFGADDEYEDCGSLANHFGPFSYYDPANHRPNAAQREGRIKIVEKAHLTPGMLSLKRGRTGLQIGGDLDYTLRAIPDHPSALDLASRYTARRASSKTFASRQKALRLSTSCYFKRALKFRPTNGIIWMQYAIHAHRMGQFDRAVERYERAGELGVNTADYYYNYGLSLIETNDLEKAEEAARKAYGMGYPLPGLAQKLKDHGVSL